MDNLWNLSGTQTLVSKEEKSVCSTGKWASGVIQKN